MKNKRKILSIALACTLAAGIAAGTYAYFTDSASLTNEFMVAEYNPDDPYATQDDIFSVKVDETDPSTGEKTEEGVQYPNIAPGDKLEKDPTVTNTGVYDEFIRVKLNVSNGKEWLTALSKWNYKDSSKLGDGFLKNVLRELNGAYVLDSSRIDTKTDTLSFTFYLNKILAPKAAEVLFTGVNIPSEFDRADMLSIQDFTIKVTAQAIQADNTGNSAKNAFDTFWKVNETDTE